MGISGNKKQRTDKEKVETSHATAFPARPMGRYPAPHPGRGLSPLRLAEASRCRLHRRYRRPGSSSHSPEASLLSPKGLGRLARSFPFLGA